VRTCLLCAADPEEVSGIARDLDLLGLEPEPRAFSTDLPDGSADIVCVFAGEDASGALAFCQVLSKEEWMANVPVLAMVRVEHLRELFLREGVFDDFLVVPYQLAEFDARLRQLLWKAKQQGQTDIISVGPLQVNLATYQVHVDGQPTDLTYMEYELLKFLVSNRGRVYTREALLSRVWGYDYYGGSRTVDVHVRRLRAKLGEHANLIQTVRNVGYKFAG